MKKFVALLLAVLMVASLCACGQKDTQTASDIKTVTAGKLTMSTNAQFPPYESVADDGKGYEGTGFEGIDIEIAYALAQKLGLGQYLKLGRGEEAGGGRERISILADATEAVFAAVYLDGGIEAASALIHRCLLDAEKEEVVEERRRDYKTELQELVQRRSGQVLHYELTGTSGPDHAKQFTFRVTLNGRELGQGTGRSKKEAEQSAARSALAQWNEQ